MQESKYWIFKIMTKDLPDDWRDKLADYTGILTSLRDQEAQPDHVESVLAKPSHYLNKHDKAEPYYYVVLLLPQPIKRTEATQIAHSVKGKFATMISDQDPIDMDLKLKLRSLMTSNVEKVYDPEKFTYFGKARWCCDSDKKWQNLKDYFYPHNYSKPQLIKYRYWTDKCLRYLPKPYDYYSNSTYKTTYPVYNQDDIEKVELTEPVKSIIAKKKKRLTDSDAIKKHQEIVSKTKATKVAHKKAKEKAIQEKLQKEAKLALTEFDQDIATIKNQYPETSKMLIAFKYLTIANHLAKTLQELNYGSRNYYNYYGYYKKSQKLSELDKNLMQKYSKDELYKIKGKALQRLYLDNFKYNKSLTPNITLQAVVPEDTDRVDVYFCEDHNEERYMFGESPIAFYYDRQHEIDSCPACQVNRESNYYSFYFFKIKVDNILYDWHLPYPLGKDWLPSLSELPQIEQVPNEEGPFLYGEEASDKEKQIANARDIIAPIKEYINESKLKQGLKQLYESKIRGHYQVKYFDACQKLRTKQDSPFLKQNVLQKIDSILLQLPENSDVLSNDELRKKTKEINKKLTQLQKMIKQDPGYKLTKWQQKHLGKLVCGQVRNDDWRNYQENLTHSKKILDNYDANDKKQRQDAENILEVVSNQYQQLLNYVDLCKMFTTHATMLRRWENKHLDLPQVAQFSQLQHQLTKLLDQRAELEQMKPINAQIINQKQSIQKLKQKIDRQEKIAAKSEKWQQLYQKVIKQYDMLKELRDQVDDTSIEHKKLSRYIQNHRKSYQKWQQRDFKTLQQISSHMTELINSAKSRIALLTNN